MKDIAQYALEALLKAGATKASCSVAKGEVNELKVMANEFTQLRTTFEDDLTLKALIDGRKGVATINKLDKDSINEAVASCITLAKSAEPDEAEDIAPLAENKDFDFVGGSVADLEGMFSRSKEYLAMLAEQFPKIMLDDFSAHYSSGDKTYVNSNGVCFNTKNHFYYFSSTFVGKEGEKSSSFNYDGVYMNDFSKPFIDMAMHRRLLEEAENSIHPQQLDGKFTGKIVVTPHCPDLWFSILGNLLGDRAMIEGTSRWKDSLGQTVADSKLTMRAAPYNPLLVTNQRVTPDGFLVKDIDFIKNGVLESFALGLYGSNKTGKPRADTFQNNIEITPGDTPYDDLIKGVERGILLNRFSGGAPGPSGDISGVAKNSFLIENGKITAPLQETMISFNLLDALKNITAISKETITNGMYQLPWCCFDGITVSGK